MSLSSARRLAGAGPTVGGCARLVLRAALAAVALLAALVFAPVALALTPPLIYWANSGSGTIGVARLDATDVNQSFFIRGASAPNGVAVDGQHIYWANATANTIGRANLDGDIFSVNQSFITGASAPSGVAVDGQHIYWTNAGLGSIGVANLDGTGVNQGFITGVDPVAVAVDGQRVYWLSANPVAIGVANLDGSGVNRGFIGLNPNGTPTGLAVDGQHIYWSSLNTNTIGVANLDGSAVNPALITGANMPFGVAVDGQRIYWTNFGSGTIGVANRDGTFVNQSFITGASNPFGVAVSVPVAQLNPAAPPAFATTPQRTLSAPLTLTVSNAGQRDLSITGVSFTGLDPGDFIVGSNSCLGSIAPGESCQLTVSFAPQAQGARSATLHIASNDYANSPLGVSLSGTGGSQPQAAGLTGAAGKIELITCRTVTTKVNGHRRKVQRCTSRLLSGTIKITPTAGNRATISRGRVTYATGASVQVGRGAVELLLSVLRPLRPGRYTLTVRTQRGRVSTRRTMITIV